MCILYVIDEEGMFERPPKKLSSVFLKKVVEYGEKLNCIFLSSIDFDNETILNHLQLIQIKNELIFLKESHMVIDHQMLETFILELEVALAEGQSTYLRIYCNESD